MPSVSNKFISNQQAVPVIDSDIFCGHEDKRFALGVYSSEDILSYQPKSINRAYLRLRANVYIDQTGMLEKDLKLIDGTELDKDDERSTHFVVIENKIGKVATFACMRLIEKTSQNNALLPIEEFFPEAFDEPAPINSIEVSRFIVRHDIAKYARIAKKELMTASLAYALNNKLGPVFGVVEPEFERDLKLMKLPLRRIAEPKLVEEYNDHNLGFEIDKYEFSRRLGDAAVNSMNVPVGNFAYWGIMPKDQYSQTGK